MTHLPVGARRQGREDDRNHGQQVGAKTVAKSLHKATGRESNPTLKENLMRHVRRWIARARQATQRVCDWVCWVLARLVNDPGYVEAVAALAVAVAELFCRNHAVRRLVHEAAHTLVVVMRALLRTEPDEATSYRTDPHMNEGNPAWTYWA